MENFNNHIETEHAGEWQLASEITKLTETENPHDAVLEYLKDTLVDAEKNAPKEIRATTFEYLANEQRNKIRQDLVTSGGKMLENLGESSRKTRGIFEETQRGARSFNTVADNHQSRVGAGFRGQLDTKRMARGHEDVVNDANDIFKDVKTHVQTLDGWVKSQQNEIEIYHQYVEKGRSRELSLSKVAEKVKNNHENEHIDLSHTIDDDVIEIAATKLCAVATEAKSAGASAEMSIQKLISQEPNSDTPKLIKDIAQFSATHEDVLRKNTGAIHEELQTTETNLKYFVTRGRNGYIDVGREDAAHDLYTQQKRAITVVAEGVENIITRSKKTFEDASAGVQDKQRKISGIKA